MLRRFLTTLSAVFAITFAQAQSRIDTLSVNISFPQGVSTLNIGYRDNSSTLTRFVEAVQNLNADTTAIIHSINISTSASPEGNKALNDRLARERAQSILSYLMQNTTLSPSQMKVNSKGENWEGLLDIVRSCGEEWKDDAEDIIIGSGVLESNDNLASENCRSSLKALRGGQAWDWMNENAFSALRNAGGRVLLVTSPVYPSYAAYGIKDTLVIYHENVIYHKDTVAALTTIQEAAPVKKEKTYRKDSLFRTPVFAFRTNLLVPLMNIGIEIPLGNRVSVEADVYSPWALREWANLAFEAQRNCLQVFGSTAAVRFWLGHKHSRGEANAKYRLRGHSIGIVATGGIYDVEYDWRGQQGECLFAGLDYMYSQPLGKGGTHMEFDLGFGYGANYFNNYDVRYEGGKLIDDGGRQLRHLPVPVRCSISFVVPITRKNRL